MPMPRVPTALCAAMLAATVLTGCLGSRLKPDAPSGAHLQGIWKLNRSASDDPQKIIDTLRAEALKKIKRAQNAPPPTAMGGPGGRRRGQQGGPDTTDDLPPPENYGQPPPGSPGLDPLRNSPMMHELREILQRSDYVTIRQSPDQVSFDYGTNTDSYTPGQHSVVSSENGVADQTSGWDGKQYIIDIKPQLGPVVVEEYGLSPDGKQLIVKTHIGPFELPKINLTRVYDATGSVVPNSGPTND